MYLEIYTVYNDDGSVDCYRGYIFGRDIVVEADDVLVGDINNDGKINAVDYFAFKSYVLGKKMANDFDKPETFQFRCDMTGDGKINAADYFKFKNQILKG